jgi:hypothetical protein
MIPMALGLDESGKQTAPLARAVIGGLGASTLATLGILPAVFTLVMSRAGTFSSSLDPFDPESAHYVEDALDHHTDETRLDRLNGTPIDADPQQTPCPLDDPDRGGHS